jgi:hypothetical protein
MLRDGFCVNGNLGSKPSVMAMPERDVMCHELPSSRGLFRADSASHRPTFVAYLNLS